MTEVGGDVAAKAAIAAALEKVKKQFLKTRVEEIRKADASTGVIKAKSQAMQGYILRYYKH